MSTALSLPAARAGRWRNGARRLRHHSGWTLLLLLLCALVALPLGAVLALAFGGTDGLWPHLAAYVLPRVIRTTSLLLLGVGLVTVTLGVGTAWLVTMCRFPGRATLQWLLLLPLAMPTYVIAYVAVELLDTLGPVQSGLRALFGFERRSEYWFPEIRSLPGAVFVMSFVLYPYVYLTTRASFLMQSASVLDASRMLGHSAWESFRRVAIPLARPAIVAGLSLALLEVLNDLGAVRFFGVETFTVSIYATWLNRGSLAGAAQIACVSLAVVIALLAAERAARRGQRYFSASRERALSAYRLSGWRAAAAMLACALPILIGFVAPAALLLDYAAARFSDQFGPAYLALARHSLLLSVLAALVTVLSGLLIAYGQRLTRTPLVDAAARIAVIGYAVPGTVLAIGVLYALGSFDNALDAFLRRNFGVSSGLLLTGSAAALVYAYSVRFMAVSYGAIETGFGKISPSLDMAARSLGRSASQTLREIHLPILRPALATAAILVFVDCMKELPATILLRPFNFDTLATFVFSAASRESFEDGALAALTIVVVGLLPVALLARTARVPHAPQP